MRAILAIARAEIRGNWKVTVLPLIGALGVLFMAALGARASDTRTSLGSWAGILVFLQIPLAIAPAAVLGLNLFGPDIRQRRLSFFLTRPCAPWQLWLGRGAGAAVLMSVGGIATLTLPHLVGANGITAGSGISTIEEALLTAGGLTAIFLVLNSASMVLAANSPLWFIADAAGAIGLLAAATWSIERTLRLGDASLAVNSVMVMVCGAMLALFAGGLAFLTAGRGNGPAGHRAHSVAWWSVGAIVLMLLGAQRSYEWSRPLESTLKYPAAMSVGPSRALVITSPNRTRRASFLLDTTTGQSRRVSGFMSWDSVHPPGSAVVGYVERALALTREDRLVVTSTDASNRPTREVNIPTFWGDLLSDVSPDGELALFDYETHLRVVRTETGATAQLKAAGPGIRWARFGSPGTIVAMVSEKSGAQLRILSLDGKVLEERALPAAARNFHLAVHRDSGRVFVTEPRIGVAAYAGDGREVARILADKDHGNEFIGAPSLSSQNVLVTHIGDCLAAGRSGFRLIRHDESVVRDLPFQMEGAPLTLTGAVELAGELESGEVMVNQYELSGNSVLVVDPSTGVVRIRLKGFKTLAERDRRSGLVPSGTPSNDSALRLLSSDDRDLFFLDPGSTSPRLLVKNTSEDH